MSKRKKKSKKEKLIDNSIQIVPKIIGGEFNYDANKIVNYRKRINAEPKGDKKRILFVTEASYLKTGFSTYLREVFRRLNRTGKYVLAEHGSYGEPKSRDRRPHEIPWAYYHNMPENEIEGQVYQEKYQTAQFGEWKSPQVLSDFKPDIVITNRDHWMDEFLSRSPLRKYFTWLWMPTVDGYLQQWEWLKTYNGVDGLFAYSWFGKRVLEEQSRFMLAKQYDINPLNVIDVCQPGTNTDIYKPMDKIEVKKMLGIPEHLKFIGTVMRNQPRKLFPRTIESFAKFKRNHPNESKNVILLLHTSIPDVGWDRGKGIINTIERCGVQI
jgi:hypothetical protein